MITGSNTNVRHSGRLFHVQTEDSGRRNPHVISHLYFGGTILASQKTQYDDLLDLESETLDKDVRALIEDQHKAMLKRLKHGEFDAVILERLGDADATDPGDTAESGSSTAPAETPPTIPGSTEPDIAGAPSATAEAEAPRRFGDGIVSQKPLDEVILEYLVEKARDRVSDRESKATRPSRKQE
jgi:hypothetical protein